MIVEIKKDKRRGQIIYSKETKEMVISFPTEEELVKDIRKFLSEKIKLRIPIPTEKNVIGAYKEVVVYPYESELYFQTRLSELYGSLGVWVDWDTLKG